ncbi:hypothetical protein HanHA300_Chr04g0142321 [Helianthus annuus]|nr:hypothetical protein HanHA300_Chr04g0142321 [Helianthus annuus]KAJ0597513.1 hypothetical protein HanHA89_Chr04g0155471 [Helianthus annuus]KAJ0758162.1 hypothetical protein HanLR1_Chr04g0147211 [Helianthus annuus]
MLATTPKQDDQQPHPHTLLKISFSTSLIAAPVHHHGIHNGVTLSTNRHYQNMQSTPGFIEPLEHHLLYLLEDPILLLMASRVREKAVAPSTLLVTGLQQTSVCPPGDSGPCEITFSKDDKQKLRSQPCWLKLD